MTSEPKRGSNLDNKTSNQASKSLQRTTGRNKAIGGSATMEVITRKSKPRSQITTKETRKRDRGNKEGTRGT